MDSSRPLTPRQPIKLNTKQYRVNKTIDPNLFCSETDGKASSKVTTTSQKSVGQYQQQNQGFSKFKEPHQQYKYQLQTLRVKLTKQEEKKFIYQNFFKKMEKALYNQKSEYLDGSKVKNYQKLQFHLADMVKRVEKGIKLTSMPVIYKKQNTVTTRTISYKPTTK